MATGISWPALNQINWFSFASKIDSLHSEHGRPAIETRFVMRLLLLKHIYGLSDDRMRERWIHARDFTSSRARSSSSTLSRTTVLT